jgi:hypothetical protein
LLTTRTRSFVGLLSEASFVYSAWARGFKV